LKFFAQLHFNGTNEDFFYNLNATKRETIDAAVQSFSMLFTFS